MDAATVQRERKSGTKCCSAVNAHFLESPSLINNFTNTKGAVRGEEIAASSCHQNLGQHSMCAIPGLSQVTEAPRAEL